MRSYDIPLTQVFIREGRPLGPIAQILFVPDPPENRGDDDDGSFRWAKGENFISLHLGGPNIDFLLSDQEGVDALRAMAAACYEAAARLEGVIVGLPADTIVPPADVYEAF